MFAVDPPFAGHKVDAVFVRIDYDRLDGLNAFGVKAVKRDVVFFYRQMALIDKRPLPGFHARL